MNLPNFFLFYRILAVPFFIVAYAQGWHVAAFIIYTTAAISDFFDGYFSRKLGLVNDFGKLMDPLADKILTAAAFTCLVGSGLMPPWMLVVILSREFLVTGLRALAADRNIIVAARFSGRLKTFLQMTTIGIILYGMSNWPLSLIGFPLDQILLWASVIVTVYSGLEYLWDHRELLRIKPSKKPTKSKENQSR